MEQKKKPELDLERSRAPFFMLGLMVSLSLSITAFEWKSPISQITIAEVDDGKWEDPEIVHITVMPPPEPPKPKIVPTVIVETKDEVEVPKEIIFDLSDVPPGEIEVVFDTPPEPVEIVHVIVEEMPSPVGGMSAFYGFLGKAMKYPKQARRMGIEGKVYVQFIIGKEGNITELEVMRGIGAGCDEEALRVLGMAPAWHAGKQRGRPVKVKMIVPIVFKLNS